MTGRRYTYTHHLENGVHLRAFSLDDKIDPQAVVLRNYEVPPLGVKALSSFKKRYPIIQKVSSLCHIPTAIGDVPYEIPEALGPFKEGVVDRRLFSNPSLFDGPIIHFRRSQVKYDGIVLSRAGYFDFLATNGAYNQVPAEAGGNPYGLPEGKTLADIVREGKILQEDQMVNYLGQAFLIIANGEMGMVQRAKGMGVVAGIPAVAGATPRWDDYKTRADIMLRGVEIDAAARERIYMQANQEFGPGSETPVGFFAPGFTFADYIQDETARELREEFRLFPGEYSIQQYLLVDDRGFTSSSMPFLGTFVTTPLSWDEIAKRCLGDPEV